MKFVPKLKPIILLLAFTLSCSAMAELPKEMQKDQYMLSLMEALKDKNYKKAMPYFKKLEDLKLPLSDSFYYFKGEALAKTNRPIEAEKVLHQYMKMTGKEGKYYKSALGILVEIEPKIEAERKRIAHEKAAAEERKRKEKAARLAKIKAEKEAKAREAKQIAALKAKLPSLSIDADLVSIPKGCFQMGSPEDEKDRGSDETLHEVCLESFKVGKYEVTQGLWQAVMGENPSSFKSGDNYPVEKVSWDDIQVFLKRLNAASGKQYRLPSEAEWEYAARAGTTSAYWWNTTQTNSFFSSFTSPITHDNANYGKDECCGGLAQGKDQWENTAPVGSFEPNPWGLYDTAGNVWEWVEDCYSNSYSGAPTDGRAQEGGSCEYRVFRGGSWLDVPAGLRSANRFWYSASYRIYNLGFRLAHD